jgi:hypothetical protein
MKNKIAILLMCASFSLMSQTKVKYSQMENPATSSVNLGAQTFSTSGSFFAGASTISGNFTLDRTSGVIVLNPKKMFTANWPTDNSYMGLWFGQNYALADNYFLLGDTNQIILNGKKSMLFNTGHRRFMSATSTYSVGGTIVTLDALTNTLTAAGEIRHLTVAGNTNFLKDATTQALWRSWLFSAETATTTAGQTATVTNYVGLEINGPTAAGGVTITNPWALSCKGNANVTTSMSIGSSLATPSAVLHVLGGSATKGTVYLANQTLLTNTVANMMEPNANILYWTNATGRMKVGLSLTGSATLNFGSTAAGAVADLTVAVTGAALNDPVTVGAPNGAITATGSFYGWVSAADVVTVRFIHAHLTNAEDPASGTFKITVNKN